MLKAVLKIGGSLARDAALPELCRELSVCGLKHPVLVVPGGGLFADAVRDCHRRFPLSESAAHWMAILGMDQFGLLLADLTPGARTVTDPAAAVATAKEGHVPILLPSAWLRRLDPLPHSWDVTSDSIAAWTAASLRVSPVVLVKDRDGLYGDDPRRDAWASHRPIMGLDELASCRGVDSHLPKVLAAHGLECWVINGKRPERLAALLATGQTEGTRVPPLAC